jgi:glycosyltransferase involved in cell wall biosynthesis
MRFGVNISKIHISANIFSKKVGFLKKLNETRKFDAIIILSDGSIPFVLSKKLYLHVQRPIEHAGHGFKNKLKLKRVSKIFCNSYFTKSYIDKLLGLDSLVIYPPVDVEKKNVKKENIILHVGRFRVVDKTNGAMDYKKQNFMVAAFKEMARDGIKGWKFILAVSVNEEELAEFENLKNKASGAPIEFIVNKSNEELWNYYSKSKIYWHASGFGENLETNPEFAEHFGISTVEAMGAGAVPVVFAAGGQKEIIEDNLSGLLWSTLPELKEKTRMLMSEKVLWERMSKEAMKRAREFAGNRFCEDVTRLLHES